LFPHPPYSLDLALSDYFFFPNLKEFFCGKRFANNEEVTFVVNDSFEGLNRSRCIEAIEQGIEAIEHL